MEDKIEADMEFTIELLYPENQIATCKLLKSEPGQVEIICTLENIFYKRRYWFIFIKYDLLLY